MKKSALILLTLTVVVQLALAAEEGEVHEEEEEVEVEPHYTILFPWFIEIIGVVVFYVISRYFGFFPYTACLFAIGTIIGIGVIRFEVADDQLSQSARIWEQINSEVLLLTFLPGLVFYDAFSLNVHLFQLSMGQSLIMAFPMVLAGTVLVACVAFYIFPYGWSFSLCMTFGSILAATDPVAVNALLSEVGAPPRLKTHITGESLLNDGSAIVFFTIFSQLFFTELGVEGLGSDVDVASGLALFFRMSLGGASIGIAFGIGLVGILYLLNKRLVQEENVLQVTSTITMAYLCYYVAEAVAGTSGVISVVFCGIIAKAFGMSLINDVELMKNFWHLVEHLLNTLLFALGGVVWGSVISNAHPREFRAADWGYLIMLYVLLTVIRFFLIAVFYPILSRIGLKTNPREAIFLGYGGLRGAVGISLALALDDIVFRNTDDPEFLLFSTQLFGMVGGIAFLTLFVNGSTAGHVLVKLGLANASTVHEKLLGKYERKYEKKLVDEFVHLLADPLYEHVDFALIEHHVPFLQHLCPDSLKAAVLKNKEDVPANQYFRPNLDKILPYLLQKCKPHDFDMEWYSSLKTFEIQVCMPLRVSDKVHKHATEQDLSALQAELGDKPEAEEYRLLFLAVLKATYAHLVEKGHLDVRAGSPGFIALALEQGLEFAKDAARRGEPLHDWEASFLVRGPWEHHGEIAVDRIGRPLLGTLGRKLLPPPDKSNQQLRVDVNRAVAFIEAHRTARKYFEEEFVEGDGPGPFVTLVYKESMAEEEKAEELLRHLNKSDVQKVISHGLCVVLLNKASRFVESLHSKGLLSEQEATEKIEEIVCALQLVRRCAADHHAGEMSRYEMEQAMEEMTTNFNV